MKISELWIREWVNPNLKTDALAHQMTMTGLEVDTVEPVAGDFSGVVIGYVEATQPHPNADKLTCCKVNVGEKELLNIVCGAKNVRPGLKVAVATVGAILPGDFKIKAAKLRGEPSQGMLCGASELGLSFFELDQAPGIMELPQEAPVGQPFDDYFLAHDAVIDIEMTPNRGDCLSVQGVARDLAVTTHSALTPVSIKPVPATKDSQVQVSVSAPAACPRYVGREVHNINNSVKTPLWMQLKLQRCGIRPINPVVDVCHFVMMELGQPMHGFDLAKLSGDVCVRYAKAGEMLTLLDETAIKLSEQDLIIADSQQPVALAGVMGGLDSGVSVDSTSIFLEAAFFIPKTVCLSARRHGLSTDASYRFERGVDYDLAVRAIERASELLSEIVGGDYCELVELTSADLPQSKAITLTAEKIRRVVGVDVPSEVVKETFEALGMSVSVTSDGWSVVPPSYRFDVTIDVELIEELIRVMGYDKIPASPMSGVLAMPDVPEGVYPVAKVADFLTSHGFYEAITYSFISPEMHKLVTGEEASIVLDNPISQELSVMRQSLIPGLLGVLQHNLRHQVERLRLFETGLCFMNDATSGELTQTPQLALLMCGRQLPEQWGAKTAAVDFYDMKGEVESLLNATGCASAFEWVTGEVAALHPGRTALLKKSGRLVGYLGECHPTVLAALGIKQPVILFECEQSVLTEARIPCYQAFSKFPAIRRDLAFVVQEEVAIAHLCELIRKESGELLKNVQVFDVYQGKGVEPGKKSIALGLTFQDASRTLVDEEINAIIHDVVNILEREMNAILRA